MIEYLKRTRDYYGALGYPAYSWAHFDTVPFAKPSKPLSRSRLALVSTAAPFQPDLVDTATGAVKDQGPGAAYNAAAKFFEVYRAPIAPIPDLRISHIGYDRKHCAADDAATWLPVAQLQQAVGASVVGSLAPELVGAPTNRSQRVTLEQDAPAVLSAVNALQADLVLLVPT